MPNESFSDLDGRGERQVAPQARARMRTISAAFVITLGLVVLTGWAQDIEVLKRIRPGFTAMNPLSALCLIFSGLGLLLAGSRWHRLTLALGSLVVLVALAKLADAAWGGVPVDQLLFAGQLGEGSELPNRMAPNTAFALAVVALGLLLSGSRRRSLGLLAQGLGASGLLISMFALMGYFFGIDHLRSVGIFIPMAVHTGICLAILSLGVMSLTSHCGLMLVLRDGGSAGSMARTVLPLAIFIPVAVGAMRLWGQNNGYYGTEAGIALQVVANVLVTSVLLTSSILALHRSDLVRRKREQDLARSEARYRLAEQVAQVGHWRMDLPSRDLSWSEEVFAISGLAKEDGVPSAATILDTYHPDDRCLVRESIRDALQEGRDWSYVVRVCRPGGELRHVSSTGVCERDQTGRIIGLFGVLADITELEHARRKAEEATAAKAVFLANMSHEIRTPLNGVMGFAELLLASELDAGQKRHATLIFDSAQTLLKLLNDILDVSKIDAGQLEIAHEPYDLAHQLRQCVRLMEGMAYKKGLALALAVDPELPKYVLGDGLRLRQILLNLLGNAIKFTASGSVTLKARAATSRSGLPVVEVLVIDTGVGIPLARQASVFEEFVQADASTSRQFGGSGLGLTISRRLAALMGGEIKLSSTEGQGTQVTLTIPMTAAGHALPTRPQSAAEPMRAGADRNDEDKAVTILLAEDLDINQELITGMLDRMGYQVEIANNGEEAFRLVGRLQEKPDAYAMVLMDIQMPVLDGIGAARAIRALGGRASEIPIVALTANAYEADILECRRAGMDDHLSKPVSMAALGAMVSRWVGQESLSSKSSMEVAADKPSLAGKFADRKAAYGTRLTELRLALLAETGEERSLLITEARKIAHNLAGTAAMFGESGLGDTAAAVEDGLRDDAEGSSAWVDQLIDALRRAA